jgi:hypothetical protein
MAAVRIAFEATYTSGTGTQRYQYTIVADSSGVISVRDIRSPFGLIMDTMTRLPQSVVDDINTSIAQVENLLTMTSAVNGTLTFVAEAEKSVTFSTPMADTNYRVYTAASGFIPARITNKTQVGFTIQLGTTFTGTVGYDVFV